MPLSVLPSALVAISLTSVRPRGRRQRAKPMIRPVVLLTRTTYGITGAHVLPRAALLRRLRRGLRPGAAGRPAGRAHHEDRILLLPGDRRRYPRTVRPVPLGHGTRAVRTRTALPPDDVG